MMRKVIASAVGAAALVVVPSILILTATPASADPNISQLCSQNADFGFSHGACVSFTESNGNSGAIFPSLCKEIQQQYPIVFDAKYTNIGNCVSTLKDGRSPSPSPTPVGTPSPSPTP